VGKRAAFGLLSLSLAGLGLYAYRRSIIARLLGLRPPQYPTGVERNIRVPMPDGVGLMADHYYPRAAGRLPAILVRSYYGRGPDVSGLFGWLMSFLGVRFAERGYHVVVQTTRGRFDSEGETEPFVDAAPDGHATLDWIARQPWCDGTVGMWGLSYLGYVQWAVATDPQRSPQLKAIVPQMIGSRVPHIVYPNGAFALDTFLRWVFAVDVLDNLKKRPNAESLRRISPQGMARYLAPAFRHVPMGESDAVAVGRPLDYFRRWLAHLSPDDPYWQQLDLHPRLPQVTAATHLIGGWYDIGLRELIDDYAALKAAGRSPYLTIGPWIHGEQPSIVAALREGIAWFDAHLKGDRRGLRKKPVRICVMGAGRDAWREMDDWPPPARETRYFLRSDGRLKTSDPKGALRRVSKTSEVSPPDCYRYDPADPTPSVGGPLLFPPSGPMDNRALEARADVLTYTTPALNRDVEVIGPVRLELFVRSSLAHTDFFGRLCDVHPDGRSINICDGLFRIEPEGGAAGRPAPARQPDGSLRIEVDMWATAHRFQRGHRIRLQVSSGAHPRWSRNLGTGEPIATGTNMLVADQTVYHDSDHPSALVLPIVVP